MNLGMNVRADALEMEYTLYNARHEMARRYARANNLNREVIANPSAWLGIITAGKTYHDLRQAFMEMGLPTEDDIRRAGIRLLKMGMLFPMEPHGRARLRARTGRDLRHRGEAAVPRDVRQGDPVRPSQRAAHRRQVRRGGEAALAAARRVRARHHRPRADPPAVAEAQARVGRGVAQAPGRHPQPLEGGHAGAPCVVLLGLPAQHVDQAAAEGAWSRPASVATRWRCGWTATS